MYSTQTAWKDDAAKMREQLTQFQQCAGQLTATQAKFKACLDQYADIQKRFARLAVYASQFHDQDTGNTAGLDLQQQADILGNKLKKKLHIFLRPELIAAGRKNRRVSGKR
jgi:oligoendopeptidase F